MTNPEYVDGKDRSTDWKDVLVRDRWRILGVLLIGAAVLVLIGVDLEIPRGYRVFAVTLFIGLVLGFAPASRLVDYLYSPSYTYLLELDARGDEIALWQLPPKVWRDLDVTDGELHQLRAAAPAWECQTYDAEQNTATGTWRGSASDYELISSRERIDEIRTVLEDLAQEGLTMRVKQSGIVRTAVRGIVLSFVEGFERETLYDGEEIGAAVDKALKRWSLDPGRETDDPAPGDDGTLAEPNLPAEAATDGGADE
jgi:hypothetical protein